MNARRRVERLLDFLLAAVIGVGLAFVVAYGHTLNTFGGAL